MRVSLEVGEKVTLDDEYLINVHIPRIKRELESFQNFTTENLDVARLVEGEIEDLKSELIYFQMSGY